MPVGSATPPPRAATLHARTVVSQGAPTPRTTSSPTARPEGTQQPRPTNTSTASITPTESTCLDEGGRIEKGSLETGLMRSALIFRVYLPPCYDQNMVRHYPVLYLMHGQSNTDEQWERIGVKEFADRMIKKGEVSPFLVVMPYDPTGVQPTESNFSKALIEELIPYIDHHYRTLESRLYRAVGGLSRGGGWAIHFGIGHWQLFYAIGAHSPAVFHSDAQQLRTWLDEIPLDQRPRIYIDIGDRDRPEIMRSALWLEAVLNEKGYSHEWYLFTGYHSEEYWREHLDEYLRWYAKLW